MDEAFPVAGKSELVDDADDAVVVVLDFAFEPLAAAQHQRLERPDHRRPLVAHVGRHRVLDFGLLHGARVHGLLQLVEAQLFAHVELNEDKDRAAECGLRPELRCVVAMVRHCMLKAYFFGRL